MEPRITPSMYYDAIAECATQDGVMQVIRAPGVWEAIVEHYNNEAIELIEGGWTGA